MTPLKTAQIECIMPHEWTLSHMTIILFSSYFYLLLNKTNRIWLKTLIKHLITENKQYMT